MATVGNFGKLITFEVSSNKMLALSDFKRTVPEDGKNTKLLALHRGLNFRDQTQMKQPSQQFYLQSMA